MAKLYLTLDLGAGLNNPTVAIDLGPDFEQMPDRDDVLPPELGGQFGDLVVTIQRREFTANQIKAAARSLGDALADKLKDEAGWHGEDRRQKAKGAET